MNTKGKPEIRVCRDCDTPLIFTFLWAYNEYYCINCGVPTEFLGNKYMVLTRELKAKKTVVEKFWKGLRKSMLPNGRYQMTGCKKCGPEDHNHHETPLEKEKSRIAYQMLESLKGCFDEVPNENS